MITEKMREINLESMYVLKNYSNNALLDLSDSIIYSIDTIKIYKLICTLVTFTEHIFNEISIFCTVITFFSLKEHTNKAIIPYLQNIFICNFKLIFQFCANIWVVEEK